MLISTSSERDKLQIHSSWINPRTIIIYFIIECNDNLPILYFTGFFITILIIGEISKRSNLI
jgi:hypothetical protein